MRGGIFENKNITVDIIDVYSTVGIGTGRYPHLREDS